MFRTLRSLVKGDSELVVYECRHCGTTLEASVEACPSCGGTEIARFVL